MKLSRIVSGLGSLIAVGLISSTQAMPPPTGLPDDAPILQTPPNVLKEFASRIQIGKLEVKLEDTSLEEVRDSLHKGSVAHQGDAGESISWLCYTTKGEAGRQRIWISGSELHGGVDADSFAAENVQDADDTKSACPILPEDTAPIFVGNRIWLNLSIREIEQRIGAKAKKLGKYFVFAYSGTAEQYDIQNVLTVETRGGRAIRLWVWKTTTN